jgi:hypothetical protein
MEVLGSHPTNSNANFLQTSDNSFYTDEDSAPPQIYLESVLPQQYNKDLQPFDTRGNRPKEYIAQNEYGFHPVLKNPYCFVYNNSDKFFVPENLEQQI